MLEIRQTRRTKQIEIVNQAGKVVYKVCRSCQLVKLAENFPSYSKGYLRPDCKTCFKEVQREYTSKIKDKRTVYKQRERAKFFNTIDELTEQNIKQLKEFANGKCMISGKETTLELDHVQALSKQFIGNTKGNVILVSPQVNQAKHTKSLFEFLESPHSNDLVDKETLIRTLKYLAEANGLTLSQYIGFLKLAEEVAEKNKEFWRR